MPEFILDHGSPEAAHKFQELDSFTQGYIEAAFFTSTGSIDDGELEHATVADLAPETLDRMIADCAAFQASTEWQAVLAAFVCPDGLPTTEDDPGESDEHAGRDFWYTRNGHGCGFWDGDWKEPYATQLTAAADLFSQVDLYRGDDGLIYS